MDTETKTADSDHKLKATRVRSAPYPSYDIDFCISFCTKIAKTYTDVVFTSRDDIGKALNNSGGSLIMQLSSSVQYGLLEIKQSEGYKPTERLKRINRPLPDEKVEDFKIECLNSPELYKKLISAFSGKQLPEEKGMSNILDRNYSVKGDASLLAAKIFYKNLNLLGLIGDGNFLNLNPEIPVETFDDNNRTDVKAEPVTTIYLNAPPIDPKPYQNPIKENDLVKKGTFEIPLPFKDFTGKVILPEWFTEAEISKTIKILTGYLP